MLTYADLCLTLIAAGAHHSVALTGSDGLAWLWGRGKEGQLGTADRTDKFEPQAPMAAMVERTPQGLYGKTIVHVSAGDWHTAFACSDGQVFTCGRGVEGQLGYADVTFALFPQRVHTLARQGVKVRQTACGREHSLFLDQDDQLWACGNSSKALLSLC